MSETNSIALPHSPSTMIVTNKWEELGTYDHLWGGDGIDWERNRRGTVAFFSSSRNLSPAGARAASASVCPSARMCGRGRAAVRVGAGVCVCVRVYSTGSKSRDSRQIGTCHDRVAASAGGASRRQIISMEAGEEQQ